MKVIKSLSPPGSDRSYSALVRVEPGETADIEQMLRLLDGDSVGHYGFTTKLVATGENQPECKASIYRGKPIGAGYLTPTMQFGFPNASALSKVVRFYECHVARD